MSDFKAEISNKVETKESLIIRIRRYKFCYLISLPAMLFIIFFKLGTLGIGLRLPFVAYTPSKGIVNSEWVGLANFKEFFTQGHIFKSVQNSIVLNLGFVLLCSIIALIIIWCFEGISSKGGLAFFTTVFLVPLFIPSVVYTYWIYILFSKTGISQNPDYARLIYICAQTLKYSGIPIIMGIASVNSCRLRLHNVSEVSGANPATAWIKPAFKVILAFSVIQLSVLLNNDYEFISTLYNNSVYSTMDVFDTYVYRTGVMGFDYSRSETKWFIKSVIQLITITSAYLLVRKFFKNDLFLMHDEKNADYDVKRERVNWIKLIPAALYAGIILCFLFIVLIYPFMTGTGLSDIFKAIPKYTFLNHFLASLAAVGINAFIIITIAYTLTAYKLPGRRLIKAVLIIALSISSYSISEYLYYRNLGMFNNYLPFIVKGSLDLTGIFVLKSIFNSKYSKEKTEGGLSGKSEGNMFFTVFLPRVWKPVIALSVLQFANCWGSFLASVSYISKRSLFTPVLFFRETLNAVTMLPKEGTGVSLAGMQLGAVITIVPVALFIIFRRCFTAETFAGQIRK